MQTKTKEVAIIILCFLRLSHIAPVLQKRAWMRPCSKNTCGADPRCARVVRALSSYHKKLKKDGHKIIRQVRSQQRFSARYARVMRALCKPHTATRSLGGRGEGRAEQRRCWAVLLLKTLVALIRVVRALCARCPRVAPYSKTHAALFRVVHALCVRCPQ